MKSRRRNTYSQPYARRQLASVQQALSAARAIEAGSDWRKTAGKAETVRRLEAAERKWQRILDPPPVERFYTLPF